MKNPKRARFIICIMGYEIEGRIFRAGEIHYMPRGQRGFHHKHWRFLTEDEFRDYAKDKPWIAT